MPEDEKYDVLEKIGAHFHRLICCILHILMYYRPWFLRNHSQGQAQVGWLRMNRTARLRIVVADRQTDPLPERDQLSQDVT